MRVYRKTIKSDVCLICGREYILSLKIMPGICIGCAFPYEHLNEMEW